ncbi:ABC transporter permease subunit [Chrysiogenes arsenatis]|uniref:ABC transporter permease subunit n=1 Tax=Chrysiogenes arsenatis TaxID=309797 RepID=UPI000487A026|nr:ABC transporter permease subunit [Chrysiogenes arsenatis]
MATSTFTGVYRRRKTSLRVKLAEFFSRLFITIGGIGTVLAVATVFIFLGSVVVPLFQSETAKPLATFGAMETTSSSFIAINEYNTVGFSGVNNGTELDIFRVDTGAIMKKVLFFPDAEPTAYHYDNITGTVTYGFADGSVVFGEIGFTVEFREQESIDEALRHTPEGELIVLENGLAEKTPSGQFRAYTVRYQLDDPIAGAAGDSILLVDRIVRANGTLLATLSVNGDLNISSVTKRRNLLTGKTTTSLASGSIHLEYFDRKGQPEFLYLSEIGDTVYVIWKDGHVVRIDSRIIEAPVIAEELEMVGDSSRYITKVEPLLGRQTLLVGDSQGNVTTWFRIKPDNATSADGALLVNASQFAGSGSPVTSIISSYRKRMFLAGYADGSVRIFHVTTDREVLHTSIGDSPIQALAISPKNDKFAVFNQEKGVLFELHAPHIEATWKSLFSKTRYETSAEAEHVWQSSSGTDDFEPKYGLIPLIFGTLKATFYSMLFGAPIALMAAIYTSEFLNRKIRARVKPVVEVMASLPSVVLGFLAALTIAPFVEGSVPAVLSAFLTIPIAFLLCAYLMQLLPTEKIIRLSEYRFYFIFLVALPLGIFLASVVGPLAESVIFYGDIKLWLNGRVGDGFPGWFLMLIPLSAIAVAFGMKRMSESFSDRIGANTENSQKVGRIELFKFLVGLVLTFALAAALAKLIAMVGFDSRADLPLVGQIFGTYVQRNALVVGFIMGFAIIPIIYTLAEDALTSVPEHLRSASLAAGATPWQTAVRIIIPTAMSGLFSALMIGLGRAVGETMIVLMAAGNTPVLEMNLFNGFRTLSANIAVELPEAVVHSTHYRTLFLAALTLFVMTFVLNTVAEVVRQRFRKKAFEL